MDKLKALITECERANQRAIDELGMGLIDLNVIERARAALAACPVPAGHAQQAEAPIDTLDLYKKLCDLWREAVAVDTVIGRPAVLRQRIGALRDRVGRMQSIHLPAAPVSSPQADPSFRALFIVRRPGHAPRIGFPVGDTAQSLVDWIKVNGPNIDVVEWNTACQPSPGTAWVTSAEEYLWAAEIEVPKAQPAPAPSVETKAVRAPDPSFCRSCGNTGQSCDYPECLQAPTAEAQADDMRERFEAWWERDGQYCRAGGGDYEKSFAFAAWQAARKGQAPILAADHTGMRVDYFGLLSQCRRALARSEPGHAEMLRQLQEHLKELGCRYYAGDANVVDEILQLYCIERDARAAIKGSAHADA